MAKRSFKAYVEQELGQITWFFINALLEWLLILILFIDGFLSFFANEFAKFFELKIPCLLCTRIDHVMVRRNPDFYYNEAICEAHKKSVSCLAYCHVHKKLSDIRKLCEGCLLSFALEKESGCDTDTYKSLIGILRKDIELFVDENNEIHLSLPAGSKDQEVEEAETRAAANKCSCCGKSLKAKSYSRSKSMGAFAAHAPAPTPRAFVQPKTQEIRNLELSQVRYTELKLLENEAEVPDDIGEHTSPREKQYKEDIKAATVPLLTEIEEGEERTPMLGRGNKFFGIPLSDSATNTPRWMARLNRKSPLERTEYSSAVESAEGSVPNEVDGDVILSNLKKQVHLDRKSLMDLCMELDEERSASAVAANNAMAMITRLQGEKAAVQMEALQYQRMMEEQAEYDQEALQEMNELLAKREEDVKVLEAELEAYREKYGVIREFSIISEDEVSENYGDLRMQSETISPSSSSEGQHVDKMHIGDQQDENPRETIDKSLKSLPGGKFLGRLSNMEKKPQPLAGYGVHSSKNSGSNNGNHTEEMTGQESRANLCKELLHLHKRVKALEGEEGLLKKAGNMLHNGDEKGNLLSELSESLQKLTQFVTNPFDDDNEA